MSTPHAPHAKKSAWSDGAAAAKFAALADTDPVVKVDVEVTDSDGLSDASSASGQESLIEERAILGPKETSRLGSIVGSRSKIVNRVGTETINVVPWEVLQQVLAALGNEGVACNAVHLEGSAAAHCLDPKAVPTFNDLDFVVHLESQERLVLEKVRVVVIKTLADQISAATDGKPCEIWRAEAMLNNQFITPPDWGGGSDAWALYTMTGANGAPSIDLKFVQRLKTSFQFAADSFHIALDGPGAHALLDTVVSDEAPELSELASAAVEATEAEAATGGGGAREGGPAVEYSSMFDDDVQTALEHLKAREVAVHAESDMAAVRGGGLLKYARHISRGWAVAPDVDRGKLQRYMVTRFAMDFPEFQMSRSGLPAPVQRIGDFLENHIRFQPKSGGSMAGAMSRERLRFFEVLEQTIVSTGLPNAGMLQHAVRYSRMLHGCRPQLNGPRPTGANANAGANDNAGANANASSKRGPSQKQPEKQSGPQIRRRADDQASKAHKRNLKAQGGGSPATERAKDKAKRAERDGGPRGVPLSPRSRAIQWPCVMVAHQMVFHRPGQAQTPQQKQQQQEMHQRHQQQLQKQELQYAHLNRQHLQQHRQSKQSRGDTRGGSPTGMVMGGRQVVFQSLGNRTPLVLIQRGSPQRGSQRPTSAARDVVGSPGCRNPALRPRSATTASPVRPAPVPRSRSYADAMTAANTAANTAVY